MNSSSMEDLLADARILDADVRKALASAKACSWKEVAGFQLGRSSSGLVETLQTTNRRLAIWQAEECCTWGNFLTSMGVSEDVKKRIVGQAKAVLKKLKK